MGTKLFGPGVNSQITLSMPQHLVVTKIALWATVLTPMTKYALEFAPLAIQLENHLPISLSAKSKMMIRSSVGSLLLMIILTLALSAIFPIYTKPHWFPRKYLHLFDISLCLLHQDLLASHISTSSNP